MSSSGVRSMDSNHKQLVVLRCKLIVVGDACVGKTALTQVFHSGGPTYPKAYLMTVGADFCVKQVPIPDSNIIVELYIFDCAGQSLFNQLGMNAKYYEDASAVMVIYTYIHIYIYIYMNIYVYIYINIYVYIHIYTYIYVFIYIYIYVFIYVYINRLCTMLQAMTHSNHVVNGWKVLQQLERPLKDSRNRHNHQL
jgi:GTPase SAR1 family protein